MTGGRCRRAAHTLPPLEAGSVVAAGPPSRIKRPQGRQVPANDAAGVLDEMKVSKNLAPNGPLDVKGEITSRASYSQIFE